MPDAVPKAEAHRGTTANTTIAGELFDGASGGDHVDSLYHFDGLAETVEGLDSIRDREIEHYADSGYIAVKSAFSQKTIDGAVGALEEQILAGNDTTETLVQFEAWAAKSVERLTPSNRLQAARKLTRFAHSDSRLAAIVKHREMLAVVSRLLGGAKPKLLQEMALLKPPSGREKPWHQDRAYFNVHDDDPIIGVWIALDEATPENGCMRLWPGHHKRGPIGHFQRRDWQICDGDIGDQGRVAVPLKPGGVLFFHALLPHGTPKNVTAERRWALQFHFHAKDARITDDEARLAVFGAEGKGAEC